jgi:ribonuclease VapC
VSKRILDASAVLALLGNETGAERVQRALPDSVLLSVNLAEVVTRLALIGMPENEITEAVSLLVIESIPFDSDLAFSCGFMAPATKMYGLSLGDRACIAFGMQTGLPVLTADSAWKELELPVEIELIR